jgi:hypothetical protein
MALAGNFGDALWIRPVIVTDFISQTPLKADLENIDKSSKCNVFLTQMG